MALDTTIGGISVRINADTTGFQAGLNKVSRQVSDAGTKLRANANQYGKWAAAGVAAAGAVGAAMVRSQMQTIDVLAKTADRLGLTTEALAGLQRSAALSGADISTMNMALQRMTRRVAEAAQGTGEAQGALKELGVDAKALAQLSPDQQFKTLADAMAGVTEQGDRVRLSMKLFDSEGVKLLNTLQMGSEALEEQERIAEKLGTALNRMDAAKVEEANDAIFSAGQAVEGIVNRVTVKLSPLMEELANQFTQAAISGEGFGDTIDSVMSGAVTAVGVFADGIHGIRVVFEGLLVGATAFRLAWLESMRVMTVGIEQFVNVGINGINKIIEAANMLGAGLDPVKQFTFGAATLFTRLSNEAGQALDDSMQSWHNLAMQPLPSETIEQWVERVQAAADEVKTATGTGDGGEGSAGGVGLSEADRKAMDERLEVIRENLKSEEQIKAESYARDLEAIEQKRLTDLENEAEYHQLKMDRAKHHADEMLAIEEKKAAAEQAIEDAKNKAKMSAASSALGALSNLMNTESRKMFEIGKIAATAQAVIDGVAAVQGAFKVGNSIGGPPLGAAYAAAAAAGALVNVQKIQSTQFGSAGTGQSFSGGQVVNNTAAQQQPEQRNISVAVTGGGIGDIESFARQLIPALNEASGDGVNYTMR